jgi:hypothetical protein
MIYFVSACEEGVVFWRGMRLERSASSLGLQKRPKAKPSCPTDSIFLSYCYLPGMDSADRQLHPEATIDAFG